VAAAADRAADKVVDLAADRVVVKAAVKWNVTIAVADMKVGIVPLSINFVAHVGRKDTLLDQKLAEEVPREVITEVDSEANTGVVAEEDKEVKPKGVYMLPKEKMMDTMMTMQINMNMIVET
jgi:hypothetical protein